MLTALVVFALVLLPDMTPVIAAMVWGPPARGHPSRVSDMGPWPPKWISHRGYGRPKWELLRLTPDQQARELDQMAKDKARGEAAKPE